MENSCVICLDELIKNNNSKLNLIPCKHEQFHIGCITNWINCAVSLSPTCPLCRTIISNVTITQELPSLSTLSTSTTSSASSSLLSSCSTIDFKSIPILLSTIKSSEATKSVDVNRNEDVDNSIKIIKKKVVLKGIRYFLEDEDENDEVGKGIKNKIDEIIKDKDDKSNEINIKESIERDLWDEFSVFSDKNNTSSIAKMKRLTDKKFFEIVEHASEKDNVLHSTNNGSYETKNRAEIVPIIISFMKAASEKTLKELSIMNIQETVVGWIDYNVHKNSTFLRWVALEHIIFPLRKFINWTKQLNIRSCVVKCINNDTLDFPSRVIAVKIIRDTFTSIPKNEISYIEEKIISPPHKRPKKKSHSTKSWA